MRDLRGEWRKLPLPRVDEEQEEEGQRPREQQGSRGMKPWGLCAQTPGIFGGMSSDVPGGRKQAPGPPTWAGAILRCTRWHTVGRVIPGGLRPRRARFRFTRRTNPNKTTTEEQEQTSVAVAKGLAPRSIHLAPGGPLLLADVGPFCLPITTTTASESAIVLSIRSSAPSARSSMR